jgi:hypothetical protein
MTICKDESINYLNSLGYNVVRLPREGITPLTVLIQDPNAPLVVTVYGHITEIVVESNLSLPTVFKNLDVGTINGLKTSRFELNLGIAFLKILLSALGEKSARIESVFKDAEQIEFEYSNVIYDTVMPTSVATFLRSSQPSFDDKLLANFDADGKAYIVIDVLKSNRFCIQAFKETGDEVEINIDAIKEVLGVSSKITVEKSEGLKVSFEGGQPLGFAIKVCPFWIEVVDGKPQFRIRPQTNVFEGEVRGSLEHPIAPTLDDPDVLTPVLIAPSRLIQFA